MTRPNMALWTTAVHDHCMASGASITPAEAEVLFGKPCGNQPASKMLGSAAANGYFRRETSLVEGRMGQKTEVRYVAIVKERAKPEGRQARSYFYGMKRVRSVFELGGSL